MITDNDEYLHLPKFTKEDDKRTFADTITFGTIAAKAADGRTVGIHTSFEMHPLAGFCFCGINVWDEIDDTLVKNALVNYRMFAPMPTGDINIPGMSFQNGSSLKMLEEGKVFQYDFVDSGRDSECHFTWTAVSDRIPYASGDHFDQLGKAEGTLVLRGETIEIDTLSIRTRAWYNKDDSSLYEAPGYERVAVIKDEKNAFCACGFDSKTAYLGNNKPSWAIDTVEAGELNSSWILKDGEVLPVKAFTATVERGQNKWLPVAFSATMTDTADAETAIEGKSLVTTPESNVFTDCLSFAIFEGTVDGEPVTGCWDEGLACDTIYHLKHDF